jgi:hypothetical protein
MRLTWNPRLAVVVLAVAFVLGAASSSFAQTAPAAPAQAAAPAKPTLEFKNDAGLIMFFVKPDRTADFEDLMTKLKEGLGKLDAPEAKQQMASLKLFKGPTAPGATVAVYMLFADPAVKNIEYWFLPILYKTYPTEAQALFQKWQDIRAANPPQGVQFFDLTQILK